MEIKSYKTFYPERRLCRANGSFIKTLPEHTITSYYYDNIKIAFYDTRDNVLYLNGNLIVHRCGLDGMSAALMGKYADVYQQLFNIRNCTKDTLFSEFDEI